MILITEYFKSDLEERNNEIITCIKNNSKLDLFSKIILLNEKDILDIDGVTNEITGQRLTFKYAFEYANKNFQDEIIVFANNDIFYDITLLKVKKHNMLNKCLALLRYDITDDNSSCNINIFKKYHVDEPRIDSQDTWIIKTPIKTTEEMDFYFGVPGCDNYIAFLLSKVGYQVSNPCYDIKTYHLHRTNKRTSNKNERVGNRSQYKYLEPSKLN
tara:strand:+ start:135 stop:779 length:645 start_codon:yes stop_codon:yes gene_type:complete